MPFAPPDQPPPNGTSGNAWSALIGGLVVALMGLLGKLVPSWLRSRKAKAQESVLGLQQMWTGVSSERDKIVADLWKEVADLRAERKSQREDIERLYQQLGKERGEWAEERAALRREIEQWRSGYDKQHDIILENNELISELRIQVGEDEPPKT